MTKAQAVKRLEDWARMFDARGDLLEAIDVLRPKVRKVAAGRPSPLAAAVARQCSRPESWGPSEDATRRLYLASFADPVVQMERLEALERGPSEPDYGMHEAPAWSDFPQGEFAMYELARELYGAERARWLASPAGFRYAEDRATFEARRAQFAYTGPKRSARPDERATFALAVLGATGGVVEPEPLPLEVAA